MIKITMSATSDIAIIKLEGEFQTPVEVDEAIQAVLRGVCPLPIAFLSLESSREGLQPIVKPQAMVEATPIWRDAVEAPRPSIAEEFATYAPKKKERAEQGGRGLGQRTSIIDLVRRAILESPKTTKECVSYVVSKRNEVVASGVYGIISTLHKVHQQIKLNAETGKWHPQPILVKWGEGEKSRMIMAGQWNGEWDTGMVVDIGKGVSEGGGDGGISN